MTNILSISIQCKQYHDKETKNTYFSSQITVRRKTDPVNRGPRVTGYYVPFQYGYGNHFIDVALNKLHLLRVIDTVNLYSLSKEGIQINVSLKKCSEKEARKHGRKPRVTRYINVTEEQQTYTVRQIDRENYETDQDFRKAIREELRAYSDYSVQVSKRACSNWKK